METRRALNDLISNVLLQKRSSNLTTSLSKGLGTVPVHPRAADFSILPACRTIQTSQTHLPKSYLNILILKSLPRTLAGCSFSYQQQTVQHVVAPCALPGILHCTYTCLVRELLMSSALCLVPP